MLSSIVMSGGYEGYEICRLKVLAGQGPSLLQSNLEIAEQEP